MALLLVDVINEFAFPEARALSRRALPMTKARQHRRESVVTRDGDGAHGDV